MRFKDIEVGDTFDFIDDEATGYNSFFDPCIKISSTEYKSIAFENKYTVGTRFVQVYHVGKYNGTECRIRMNRLLEKISWPGTLKVEPPEKIYTDYHITMGAPNHEEYEWIGRKYPIDDTCDAVPQLVGNFIEGILDAFLLVDDYAGYPVVTFTFEDFRYYFIPDEELVCTILPYNPINKTTCGFEFSFKEGESRAYDEGYSAQGHSLPLSDNIYREGTSQHKDWNLGWKECEAYGIFLNKKEEN